MTRYSYRRLKTVIYDKHNDWRKPRGGDRPDRYLELEDSTSPEKMVWTDERGDDYKAFFARVERRFLEYLNVLGADGWQVVVFESGGNFHYWPFGNYLLIRQIDS